MMNSFLWFLFLISVVLFILSTIVTQKTHIWGVFKDYFSVYLGGKKENKRLISISSLMSIGFLPYVIGVSGTLLFKEILSGIDLSFLVSFDGMMISILAVFFGLGVYLRKDEATKYVTSILFISIFLLFVDVLILWLIMIVDKSCSLLTILWCVYYGLKTKIIVLFFVSLHNVYYLNKNTTNVQK